MRISAQLCAFLMTAGSLWAGAGDGMTSRTQVHMGTYATLTLPTEERRWFESGFETIRSVERALSSYAPEAEIYRLNHERRAKISEHTYRALLLCRRYFRQSGGYFDVTVGAITKGLYRFGEEERVAEPEALERAVVSFGGLHFSRGEAFLDEGITVDLGGMGKGYGVDRVAELYRRNGLTRGKIAISGDIRCLHRCEVGLQDPFGKGVMLRLLMAGADMGISTSGNYRRYVGTPKANHLIDPKRKRSQQRFASVTVAGRASNSDLDAYATAAAVMPEREAAPFLIRMGVDYLLVTVAGKRIVNRDYSRYAFFYRL